MRNMVEGGVSQESRRTSRRRQAGWPEPAASASEPAEGPLASKTPDQREPNPRVGLDATSTMARKPKRSSAPVPRSA